MQIDTCARHLHLSNSDLIRLALKEFMNRSAPHHVHQPAEADEATALAVIARIEKPLKRAAAIHHHIAFLNYEEHGYHGFRFSISRQKHTLRRYFSPKDYGSEAAALAAAVTVRDYVLEQLNLRPNALPEISAHAMSMELPRNMAPKSLSPVYQPA